MLIFEEGWLKHIIDFLERRPDVGLLGFAGRHTIKSDGILDFESEIANMRGYPQYAKPTWKIAEVALLEELGG